MRAIAGVAGLAAGVALGGLGQAQGRVEQGAPLDERPVVAVDDAPSPVAAVIVRAGRLPLRDAGRPGNVHR